MDKYDFRVWDVLYKKIRKWEDIFHHPAWEIFPGTPEQRPYEVMQHIGTADMYGKKIYEDDLIQYHALGKNGDEKFNNRIGKVIFNECSFMLCFGDVFIPIQNNPDLYEIIGNIYENPELLEVKDEE